jgi:transposase InsO family protein
MSWGAISLMDLRKEFVIQAAQNGANIAELCRRYNISRKTGYKWIARFETNGKAGLIDLSKRPKNNPDKTSKKWINRIIAVREKHPAWGARKIRVVLLRTHSIKELPACSTIHKILAQHGYIVKDEHSQRHFQRFEHEAPNHLWQMDFKGHFAYEHGRCHPLTILDDHSRFSVLLKACQNETKETVQPLLIEAFKRYGLPERINVDNGSPWGSLFQCARYTSLSVWLIRIGVKVSYSRPRHPQTNGKNERFHRTLNRELIRPNYFRNIKHIQDYFDKWRDIYNVERPHEGIEMKVPAERFYPSYRIYPEVLPEIEYEAEDKVRIVDCRGRISLQNRNVFVGMPFAKEPIAIRASVEHDVVEFFYAHQKLGEIDLSAVQKNTMINLYSHKVSLL